MTGTHRTSWSGFAVVLVLTVVAVGLCVGPALFGHQHWSVGGPIGAVAGTLGVARSRDADFWRLPRPARRRVAAATLAGVPTTDPELDAVVLGRLERAVLTRRGNRAAVVVVDVVVVALPVAAAVRVSPWYLLCLLPAAHVALDTVPVLRAGDPRLRLARFRSATGGARAGDGYS